MADLVLVTGAAGVIGSRLLPALSRAGWRTRALVHRREVAGADEFVRGSIESGNGLSEAVREVDAVLHLAARTHARLERTYRKANVEGTARLLNAAREGGTRRFVFVSTRAVSASGGGYSRSKQEAEAIVRDAALPHVVVRLPEVYGGGGREGIDEMIARARRGAPIPVVGAGADQLCPLHVDDAVAALVSALSSAAADGTTYTLAGECLSARRVAEACASAFGARSRVVSVPTLVVRGASLTARVLPLPIYPDQLSRLRSKKPPPTTEAREDLGFAPRGLREGLAELGARRTPGP